MAKQKGIIPLSGTLEGINFYFRNGVAVARKAGGGFTSKAVKNSPKMVRVRENSSEFGNCSKTKKVIRESLQSVYKDYKDVFLHGRMMQLLQQVKNQDTFSVRGQRNVAKGLTTVAGQQLLYSFRFTEGFRLADYSDFGIAVDPTNFALMLNRFDTQRITSPQHATHFRLTYLVCSYDFSVFSYRQFEASQLFSVQDVVTSPLFFIPDVPTEGLTNVICYFVVQFYQEVGGVSYVLKDLNTLGLSCVYIDFKD